MNLMDRLSVEHMLKTGLALMRSLALKKCTAGGNGALAISSRFSLNRSASSCRSASLSSSCPPVCMEASSRMRASLCRGSGPASTPHR
ncbi:hypothetical protein EYF80_004727 [Liparis tanakae]|uniref:Uncharacterized protein n=1 Tax=Liparis tanakae TaxID=230148 RepID=A0A4Z2J697_9TELE|nr:hypothetical protein EYF80_004727 [Liparis tanakae]